MSDISYILDREELIRQRRRRRIFFLTCLLSLAIFSFPVAKSYHLKWTLLKEVRVTGVLFQKYMVLSFEQNVPYLFSVHDGGIDIYKSDGQCSPKEKVEVKVVSDMTMQFPRSFFCYDPKRGWVDPGWDIIFSKDGVTARLELDSSGKINLDP